MRIGFTGTQYGMTMQQIHQFEEILRDFFLLEDYPRGSEFHHGNCVGADSEAAYIADDLGLFIHAWPGHIPHKQATLGKDWVTHPAMNTLDRNMEIILTTDILIAAPSSNTEQQRSGTWATVRRARVRNKPVIMLSR